MAEDFCVLHTLVSHSTKRNELHIIHVPYASELSCRIFLYINIGMCIISPIDTMSAGMARVKYFFRGLFMAAEKLFFIYKNIFWYENEN